MVLLRLKRWKFLTLPEAIYNSVWKLTMEKHFSENNEDTFEEQGDKAIGHFCCITWAASEFAMAFICSFN